MQHLNEMTAEDIELRRDAEAIRSHKERRIIVRQFSSKFCRRSISRLGHILWGDE